MVIRLSIGHTILKGETIVELVTGYSKLSKSEKIQWLVKQCGQLDNNFHKDLLGTEFSSRTDQEKFDQFSENTIGNFHIPFGIAPNFLIDGRSYAVPMVIEESSVVAAASKAAKFWSSRGGFKTEIKSMTKRGHIYLQWDGDFSQFEKFYQDHKERILNSTLSINKNMERRGGGILSLELETLKKGSDALYRFELKVNTCDAMGANYINSLLEKISESIGAFLPDNLKTKYQPVMAILSNSTPECLVTVKVGCELKDLGTVDGLSSAEFSKKLKTAVDIAKLDSARAVTHNKGIMNGVDAVVLATGNDFRAIEASCHSYAARNGKYESLSSVSLENEFLEFSATLPLALGTVGGLTKLHPLANYSLKILGNPDAKTLIAITASVGLAQNFGALRSLITTGIQKGHMKMHLMNILNQLEVTKQQEELAITYFKNKVVSYSAVQEFLKGLG